MIRNKFFILTIYALLLAPALKAQQVRPATSAQVYHEIAQLKNLVNVLYLAAHPDDENTRLLGWLVNDQHLRTAYLSLTRGDGGQNILGPEQGAALGLIRTHELLEARKLDGAEQYFTRAIDFGFSKTSEETFKHWDTSLLTNDVVWIYRKFRPDVVICRFPPTAQAGHGQHAASAIIAAKAFDASGDKTRYAQQLKYYKSWQPTRLVFNAFRFSSGNTISEDMYKLTVGNYNPMLGMGYGELAGISRSIHKSQGAGTPSTAGVQQEYFRLVAGDSFKTSLFDGIDVTWNRVDRPEIGEHIEAILQQYDFQHPEASLPALLELRKEITSVKNRYWREQKLRELNKAILHAAGIMAEAFTRQAPEAVAGDTIKCSLNIISRSDVSVRIKSISWISDDTAGTIKLKKDTLLTLEHKIVLPDTIVYTEPYWLAMQPLNGGHYSQAHNTLLGYAEAPNDLNVELLLKIGKDSFYYPVPLSYKKLDPTRGDIVEPLRIVPPYSIEFSNMLLVTRPDGAVEASVSIHPFRDVNDAVLMIAGDSKTTAYVKGVNLKKNVDTTIKILFDKLKTSDTDYYLQAGLMTLKGMYARTRHLIQYDHIPKLQYFTTAYAKVVHPNWQVKAKKIGYVEGAGDNVDDILRLTGLQVDLLGEKDMVAGKLKQYDAIVVGIRAINTEKKMLQWMHELLQYTNNGGTLIMQYNTLQDMATKELGPYAMTLSNKRVTEEDAKVEYLLPEHKLLNYPNKITEEDWKGWQQERGLYFMEKWDGRYQPLFSIHDTGEEPLKGSTLYTAYGKGHYIYTSLAFFRQLPAGNKGAIRLMMNMLSIGQNR
jgi:LmbE family N-acetylglucosaminyl deacetylase